MVIYVVAYLLLVILGLGGSYLMVWVSLEGCLLLVIYGLVSTGSRTSALFEYFVVQTMSSMMLVSGVVVGSTLMTALGLAFKVGLFPFWGWVYRVVLAVVPEMGVLMISGLQKVVPLCLYWESGCITSPSLLLMSALALGAGGVMLLSASGFLWAVVSSSLMHTGWVTLLLSCGSGSWLPYFVSYLVLLVGFSVMLNQAYFSGAAWVLVVMSGLVPTLGFALKVFTFMSVGYSSWVFVLLLIMSGVAGMCGYVWGVVGQLLWVSAHEGATQSVVLWPGFLAGSFLVFMFVIVV